MPVRRPPGWASFGGGLAGAEIKNRKKKKPAGQTWTYPEKSFVPQSGSAATKPQVADPAEAETDRIVAEMLAELGYARDAARREAERTAQNEIQRSQALAQALQQLGMPQLIQGVYQNSGQSLAGMAEGFSQDVQGLASQQAAEQGNILAGTGQEGAIRNEGQNMGDVLYGQHGFIPARGLEQTGAAFASEAALQPGFALQFGNMAASGVMKDFQDEILGKFADDEAMIRSKRPSILADARDRQAALKDAKKKEAYELFEAGLITQRELAKRLGVPDWKKFPVIRVGEGEAERLKANASLSDKLGYLVDDYGSPILSSNGKPIVLPKEPQKLDRFGSASAGYWAIDPITGKIVNLLPPQPKQYAPKGYQLKTLKDGSTAIFDPNTGATQVVKPPPKALKKGKPLTRVQKARYRSLALEFAEDMLHGWDDEDADGNPIVVPGRSLPAALEELKKLNIDWNFGKNIVTNYYKKNFVGPLAPGKDKPAKGGRRKNVNYQGPESLAQPLWNLFGYALEQGFTNLGTHNPASRLPGGGMSDHAAYPARAFDIGGFSGGFKNKKARDMFWYMTRQPGVEYVILGDKIWSRSRGLHAYTSGGHDTHIHVSGTGSGSA